MNGDIDKLIRYIAKHFVFDETIYPELKGASEKDRLAFAIRHLALHFAKTAGVVAAASERIDHGKEIDLSELKRNVPKALINVLRLAELLNIQEADLISAIEEKYGDSIDT